MPTACNFVGYVVATILLSKVSRFSLCHIRCYLPKDSCPASDLYDIKKMETKIIFRKPYFFLTFFFVLCLEKKDDHEKKNKKFVAVCCSLLA